MPLSRCRSGARKQQRLPASDFRLPRNPINLKGGANLMITYPANLKRYQTVEAWIDGASKGNPGPGGYGIVLRHKKTGATRYLAGAQPKASNNQMELLAAI